MLSVYYSEEIEQQAITDVKDIPESAINFTKCTFRSCDLSDFKFVGILDSCVFDECNLSLTSFQNAMLQGVMFVRSKLLGVDFTNVNSLGLTIGFQESLLRSCNFNYLDLKKSTFTQCEIIETDFIGCNLKESNFTGTSFRSVTFHETNLTKANFTDAHDYKINPLTDQIKGAVFCLPDAISLLECMGIKLK
jgi:uncharacterized protein YjbI with pentapeptide repeats